MGFSVVMVNVLSLFSALTLLFKRQGEHTDRKSPCHLTSKVQVGQLEENRAGLASPRFRQLKRRCLMCFV